jgi:hypothetical protein
MQEIKVKRIRETETAVVILIGKAVKILSKRGKMYAQVRDILSG